jgi:hypothetical protein
MQVPGPFFRGTDLPFPRRGRASDRRHALENLPGIDLAVLGGMTERKQNNIRLPQFCNRFRVRQIAK